MDKKNPVKAIPFTLLLLLGSVAYSHDIWLFAEGFRLSKGDTLIVRQLVGHELDIEVEIELLWRMTPRFELIIPDSTVDLLSELPDFRTLPFVKPVLERKLDFEGLALITMDHAFIHHEMSEEKFREYLEEEEFKIEKNQDQIGHNEKETERYARTLKCLVQVGEVAEGDLHKKVTGQKLEILLLQNPYLLDPGDELEVQVLFDGEPLTDQLVKAFNEDGKERVTMSKTRTDERGIARFKLDGEGFWLLRLVHLFSCTDPYVDWESHWASYSFELD